MSTAAHAEASSPSLDELATELAVHRAARVARLTAEDGWLTVVGKTWLTDGRYTVGAAAGSPVELPGAGAPARAGTLTVAGGQVLFDAQPGVEAFAKGVPVLSAVELEGEGVRIGTHTLQLVRRGDDVAVRVRDTAAPARMGFAGIPAYQLDPSWRVWATLRPHTTEQRVVVEDGDGRPQEYISPGIVVFEREGAELELEPVYDSGRRRLFVLFADATNRDATYGAGRFLYTPLPEAGRVLLDFNQAFNPPCAFTPHATCPLPPPNNRLRVRVEAGEKKPAPY